MLDLLWWATLALAAVFVVYFVILRGLPEHARIQPARVPVPFPIEDMIDEFVDVGFEQICGPLFIDLPTSPVVIPFHNATDAMYATVYFLQAAPSRCGCDVMSKLAPAGASLTTGMDYSTGSLPTWPGGFRQILPKASPSALVDQHRRALDFLHARGIAPLPTDPEQIEDLLRESFRRQRDTFTLAPVRGALIALWRMISRRNPHVAPLQEQPQAVAEIRTLAARATAHV